MVMTRGDLHLQLRKAWRRISDAKEQFLIDHGMSSRAKEGHRRRGEILVLSQNRGKEVVRGSAGTLWLARLAAI